MGNVTREAAWELSDLMSEVLEAMRSMPDPDELDA